MAVRLGQALSDVQGNAGQLLKVNTGGDGFTFESPPSLPAYTVTNESTDRVIDASDVTLDEVANVLGTLIKDMATIYSGGSGFQRFVSETFLHTNSGPGTTYTVAHNFGVEPDLVVLQAQLNGVWLNLTDYWYYSGVKGYGWQPRIDGTLNAPKYQVLTLVYYNSETPDNTPIRFVCLKF